MRLALACLFALPCGAIAETFTVQSAPDAVTVYADAARVERRISLTVPEGQHEVVLPGLPLSLDERLLRVSLNGAALGTTEFRRDAVLPRPDPGSPAIKLAQDRIDAATLAMQTHDDRLAETLLAAEAAAAKIAFLDDLGSNDGLPADVATLRDLTQMIGTERLAAEREKIAASQAARNLDKAAREDLEKALQDAIAALAALTPPAQEAAQLTLSLSAEAAGDVTVSLSYFVPAGWEPAYDIYLGEDNAQLELRRAAMVRQWSGEAWDAVALTLSTFQLNAQVAPQVVNPIRLYLQDDVPAPQPKVRRELMQADMAGAAFEAPVMVEKTARANFDGPGVTYAAPRPVSVASDVDAVRVTLDRLQFDARRFARAAPRLDDTAFLMVAFTNDTQEPLLASANAAYYLDNTLIGRSGFEQVPAGSERELPFGPIEELRLDYTVLNENEGDRGFINRSNERAETVRLDVENLGGRDWEVEVLSAVPYAVQEDLEVDWTAVPAPDSQNVKDKRGVLQWDMTVPAGTTKTIEVKTNLKWPEGKVVR